jgi:hypothetical protein
MQSISIQVTYRRGRPFAAYIHLGHQSGEKAARSEEVAPELVADFAADGRVLGVEVISPGATTVDDIFDVFDKLGLVRPTALELAPLVAA